MRTRIAIVGMGHVGLTLALALAEKDQLILGVEASPETLKNLQNISPPFFETDLELLLKKHLGKNLQIVDTLPGQGVDTYILCVGTPLDQENKTPDLKTAISAMREIAGKMREDSLVVLRSTVPVGTSRKHFIPLLQATRKKFYYACCPERTCEGIALRELRELPQIIGGMNNQSSEMAEVLFKKISPRIVLTPALEAAEIVKLIDNCWRDTTFAFANEMATLCESLGLDAHELIDLANLEYSRNAIPKPGFVGGPCLTKDPYLLTKPASAIKAPLNLPQTARRINQELPKRICHRLKHFFHQNGKDIGKCKIFLSGFAFKGDPPTDDIRGSSSVDFAGCLREEGMTSIFGHDFVVPVGEIAKLDIRVVTLEEGFQNADAALILNNHKDYRRLDLKSLLEGMNKPAFFFDGWHLFAANPEHKVPGITYGGIGF